MKRSNTKGLQKNLVRIWWQSQMFWFFLIIVLFVRCLSGYSYPIDVKVDKEWGNIFLSLGGSSNLSLGWLFIYLFISDKKKMKRTTSWSRFIRRVFFRIYINPLFWEIRYGDGSVQRYYVLWNNFNTLNKVTSLDRCGNWVA